MMVSEGYTMLYLHILTYSYTCWFKGDHYSPLWEPCGALRSTSSCRVEISLWGTAHVKFNSNGELFFRAYGFDV